MLNNKDLNTLTYLIFIMTQEYKPKKKDVLEEMVKGGIKGLKTIFKTLPDKETIGYFTATVGVINLIPYSIPSTIRILNSSEDIDTIIGKKLTDCFTKAIYEDKDTVVSLGFLAGGFGLIGQISAYITAIENGYPEVLLIPVISNAFSGINEIVRKYKNIKEDLIWRHQVEIEDLKIKKTIESLEIIYGFKDPKIE